MPKRTVTKTASVEQYTTKDTIILFDFEELSFFFDKRSICELKDSFNKNKKCCNENQSNQSFG